MTILRRACGALVSRIRPQESEHGGETQIDENAKTDPRVIRTRELLVDAVLTLLKDETRSSSALSISEITALARVSRPTFYQHYASPDRLIVDAVRRRLEARLDFGLAMEAG